MPDEHQADEMPVDDHGTDAGYQHGCRCRACRWAHLDALEAVPRLRLPR